jgi:hypothetical protein
MVSQSHGEIGIKVISIAHFTLWEWLLQGFGGLYVGFFALASLLVFWIPIARLVEAKKRYVLLMGIGVGSLATVVMLILLLFGSTGGIVGTWSIFSLWLFTPFLCTGLVNAVSAFILLQRRQVFGSGVLKENRDRVVVDSLFYLVIYNLAVTISILPAATLVDLVLK